jgi:hypothetical protein
VNAAPPDPYELTRLTLESRSRRFRNLVVWVVAIWLAAAATAAVLWSWKPLLGWLLAVPACGLFVTLDARAVARWRADLLDEWAAGRLDLDALHDGLTAIKLLPTGTIAGMLAPLPTRTRLACFPDPKPLTRAALAATVREMDSALTRQTATATLAAGATAFLIVIAPVAESLWPLTGLPVALGLFLSARRVGARPPGRWRHRIAELRAAGLESLAFAELAGRLAWESFPPGARENWLATPVVRDAGGK